ncbi:MAG: type I pullulanase [Bacillales bacterium]|jgi:pullulanase|nr:type I pullulanase [Bacillales bacterium]
MRKLLRAFVESFKLIRVVFSKMTFNGEGHFYLVYEKERIPLRTIRKRDCDDTFEYEVQYDVDILSKPYHLESDHGLQCQLTFRNFVKDPFFDIKYAYEGNDLGPTYTKTKTTIKVWSPVATTLTLELYNGKVTFLPFEKAENGVFSITLMGNYEGYEYNLLCNVNDRIVKTIDPYAYGSTANHNKSVILDLDKIKVKKYSPARISNPVDHIVYELNVRDFSSDKDGPFLNKGMYKAFLEKGLKTQKGFSVGIDYLKELGVTSIQLSPLTDFGSVDENYPYANYNWGYDPVQYNVCEGSYTLDIDDPYARIIQCQEMIEALHEKGLQVILDVVFNHMFDAYRSPFEILVPHYFFREDEYGNPSNGSFCSNDFDSCKFMARKYILDILKRWISFYNVDGFRFDLMGITDIETINQVYKMANSLKSGFLIYGEGWNMPTYLDDSKKAMQTNNKYLPNIAFFSDRFRDVIRGSNEDSNKGLFSDGIVSEVLMKDVLTASTLNNNLTYKYLSANNVVNYVECHDNLTAFDKLEKCNPYDTVSERYKRLEMMLAVVLLSPGIPFIHAGQEFFLSKQGDHNSFISGDKINRLAWNEREKHYQTVEFFKKLILIRKNNPVIRVVNASEIKDKTEIYLGDNTLFVKYLQISQELMCIYNLSYELKTISLNGKYFCLLSNDTSADTVFEGQLELQPLSMVVLTKR